MHQLPLFLHQLGYMGYVANARTSTYSTTRSAPDSFTYQCMSPWYIQRLCDTVFLFSLVREEAVVQKKIQQLILPAEMQIGLNFTIVATAQNKLPKMSHRSLLHSRNLNGFVQYDTEIKVSLIVCMVSPFPNLTNVTC